MLLPRNAPAWLDRLCTWLEPFEDGFGHVAQRGAFRRYVLGLLSDSRRKSMSAMLERVSAPGSYEAFQYFITDAPWSWALDEHPLKWMCNWFHLEPGVDSDIKRQRDAGIIEVRQIEEASSERLTKMHMMHLLFSDQGQAGPLGCLQREIEKVTHRTIEPRGFGSHLPPS